VEKLCNKFKKSTGSDGGGNKLILNCQKAQSKIPKKCASSLTGVQSSDEGGGDSNSGDDEGSESN
jgi:hypothetical protein